MPSDPSYVPPYQGMGGRINSMQRYDEMQRRTGAVPPPGPPAAGMPPAPAAPQGAQSNSIIQGLLNAMGLRKPAVAAAPPQGNSFDSLLQGMQDTNQRAARIR